MLATTLALAPPPPPASPHEVIQVRVVRDKYGRRDRRAAARQRVHHQRRRVHQVGHAALHAIPGGTMSGGSRFGSVCCVGCMYSPYIMTQPLA